MPGRDFDVRPADGLEPQVGLLLEMLDATTRKWRRELGRVSKAAVGWQPFPGGHSIGVVILHLAETEAWWLHEVGGGMKGAAAEVEQLIPGEINQYAVRWPEPPVEPLSWYFEQHDAVRERSRAIVRELNDLEGAVRRGKSTFTLRWLLHHVLAHEAYHGGQAVLLSLMWKKMRRP